MKGKTFILFFVLIASAGAIFAENGICGAKLTWTLSDNGTLTISGTGDMDNYVYGTSPWFAKKEVIKKVVMENGVTNIGQNAFSECCSMASVEIPSSVTSIGEQAFFRCSSLTSVTIPNSVTSIGDAAFYYCSGLISPVYNAHVFAFMPTSYSGAYTIPDGIESIAGSAFYNCSGLTSVTIPNSVASIGDDAFYGCTNLPVIDNIRYADTYVVKPFISEYITTCKIQHGTKWIGNRAFEGCVNLTSISIPNSVTRIGNEAFYGCENLASITIPNSVTSIGDGAFSGCNFTSVSIPSSVTEIGEAAFYSSKLPIINGLRYADTYLIEAVNNQTTYTIRPGTKWIGSEAFEGCNNMKKIVIPNSVTKIGIAAFSNCDNLPVVDGLRYADTYLDEAVDKTLSSYTIKTGTRWIGILAFVGCENLEKVIIPSTVTNIERCAFKYCDNLKLISIPKSVTFISKDAFSKNTKLLFERVYAISNDTTRGIVELRGVDGHNITIIAKPNRGYQFVQWSDGVIANPRSLSLSHDSTITAEFTPEFYSINVTGDSTRGSVEGESGRFEYLTTHQYKASPNYGYHFVQWSDGNTDNPRTIIAERDITISAIFAPNKYIIKDGSNTRQGNIVKAGEYDYLTECKITANPNKGYHFVQWSDGELQSTRVFTLTQDTTFVAEFEISRSGSCGIGLHWEYNKETKTLTISGNGSLSSNAFFGLEAMNEMEHLIIEDGVVNITSHPLWGECNTLQTITNYAPTPQLMLSNAFSGSVYSSATLFVPKGSKGNFKKATGWENFKKIKIIKE